MSELFNKINDVDNENDNNLIENWWNTYNVNENKDKIDTNNNLNEISYDNDVFDIYWETKIYKRKENILN